MKKIIVLSIAVFLVMNLSAQEYNFQQPDYKKIEKEINNKKSDYYYQKLFDRFVAGDTTFNLEEKRHLYYGYSFQKEYSPYGISVYNDSLSVYYKKDSLTESDLQEIIKYSLLVLEENPFDITAIDNLSYCYFKQENFELETIYSYKSYLIYEAILSTGDGLSEETAFYVISVSHEYDLLDALGFTFGGEQSLTMTGYDYLKLDENEFGIEGLYFEISRCFASLNEMFK